ncbi:MAG: hypothetical protein PHV82_05560, partial [Victivallaceae bacterium]|nr:hypothetical protein [Victivallaceae bacterium]
MLYPQIKGLLKKVLLLIAVLLAGICNIVTGDDCVGYWNFNENTGSIVNDASAYGNDGTLYNMNTATCWVTGKPGTALEFDGVDDYVRCQDINSLNIPGDITIEMCINPSQWASWENIVNNNLFRIFHRGYNGDKRIHFLYRINEADYPGDSSWGNWAGVKSNTVLEEGKWYHIAAVKSGNTMAIYINGKKERELDCLLGYSVDNSQVTYLDIGKNVYSGSFCGKLDELTIYSYALDEDTVFDDYLQKFNCSKWLFEEGTGNTVNDSSAYGNDGTLYNMNTATCWVTGKPGTALEFDGVDDYVRCQDINSLNIPGDITLEMCINPSQWASWENIVNNNLFRIFHRGYNGDKRIHFLYRINEAAHPGDSSWDNWAGVISTTALEEGKWYHIAAVKSGNTMTIYINGKKERELDCLEGYSVDNSQATYLDIGKNVYSGSFCGKLDEVTIYSHALDKNTVFRNYLEKFTCGKWLFEEGTGNTVNDSSAYGNDGTLYNMNTATCWGAGISGTALEFDGTDDYVRCQDINSLNIPGDVTIEMSINPSQWASWENIVNNNLFRIFHRGYNGDKRIYFLYRINEADYPGDSSWGNWAGVKSNTALEEGKWYHIAAVKSGNTMAIYINGQKERELNCLEGYSVDNSQATYLDIGKNVYSGSFCGKIDNLQIMSRSMDADEIRQHYCLEYYGFLDNSTANPVGGGVGYTDIISPAEATIIVSTKNELLTALSTATPGDIIYIADTAEINLTGESGIVIPAGVTLCSGRGENGSEGALIYNDDIANNLNSFLILNDDVRVTGLRVRGPDQETQASTLELPNSEGLCTPLDLTGTINIEIDNCEIFGWSHAGIKLYTYVDAYVHHNDIHHCRRVGIGYGVVLYHGATALIEANRFDWCRHSIAGSRDYPVNNFEACYNLVLGHGNGHSFDMHGGADLGDYTDTIPAGGTIDIHHNTFYATHIEPVVIRGIPATGVWVYNNWSYSVADKQFIYKQSIPEAYEKMYVYDNYYGFDSVPGSIPAIPAPTSSTPSGAAWYRLIDKRARDIAFGITYKSGYIYTTGISGDDILTSEYDANGNTVWEKYYSTIESIAARKETYAIAVDNSGNVYAVGKCYRDVTMGYDILVIKYNSAGDMIWSRFYDGENSSSSYDGTDDDIGYGICIDDSNNNYFYITGYSAGDCIVIKYDSDGNLIWKRNYDSGNYDRGFKLVFGDNNIYVTGMTYSSANNYYNCLLLKYDTDGTLLLQADYDSGFNDSGYDIALDSAGNIYISGVSYNGANWDCLVLKYAANGTLLWSRNFDNGAGEYGRGIAIDASGIINVAGYSDNGGNKDFLTVKFDAGGNMAGTPLIYDSGDIDQAYD